jgi:hypothetical protein
MATENRRLSVFSLYDFDRVPAPTEAMPLTSPAKLLVILQSGIALVITRNNPAEIRERGQRRRGRER